MHTRKTWWCLCLQRINHPAIARLFFNEIVVLIEHEENDLEIVDAERRTDGRTGDGLYRKDNDDNEGRCGRVDSRLLLRPELRPDGLHRAALAEIEVLFDIRPLV